MAKLSFESIKNINFKGLFEVALIVADYLQNVVQTSFSFSVTFVKIPRSANKLNLYYGGKSLHINTL
jgi:hypothetical protein